MITFHECLQEYYKLPWAITFSQKKIKKMSTFCKYAFDNRPENVNRPPKYVESKEGDETFTVRAYPETFRKFIMNVINKTHSAEIKKVDPLTFLIDKCKPEEQKPTLINTSCSEVINAEIYPCEELKEPPKPIKIRKRIPIIKPAYSAKPKTDI